MLKQVILVPLWLKMQTGKVASQCCWAAVRGGTGVEKRIILKVDTDAEMQRLWFEAENAKLCRFKITDEGLTEVPPGSVTAVSFIGEEEEVDKVTRGLPLL